MKSFGIVRYQEQRHVEFILEQQKSENQSPQILFQHSMSFQQNFVVDPKYSCFKTTQNDGLLNPNVYLILNFFLFSFVVILICGFAYLYLIPIVFLYYSLFTTYPDYCLRLIIGTK